jgi:hypothetical protein
MGTDEESALQKGQISMGPLRSSFKGLITTLEPEDGEGRKVPVV